MWAHTHTYIRSLAVSSHLLIKWKQSVDRWFGERFNLNHHIPNRLVEGERERKEERLSEMSILRCVNKGTSSCRVPASVLLWGGKQRWRPPQGGRRSSGASRKSAFRRLVRRFMTRHCWKCAVGFESFILCLRSYTWTMSRWIKWQWTFRGLILIV